MCKLLLFEAKYKIFLCNAPKLEKQCNKTDFFYHYYNDRFIKGEKSYNVIINAEYKKEWLRGDVTE